MWCGAVLCCAVLCAATGFDEKYPGINLRLLTLTPNFRIPFYGFYLTALGICGASPPLLCSVGMRRG
jgi:hypothetical protein